MSRRISWAGLAFLLGFASVWAAPPVVTKVEPPNWWAAHSLNPVRLLLTGTNLHNARFLSAPKGFRFSKVQINPAGTHLFVDLAIAHSAQAGPYNLAISTKEGSASIRFELLAPLSRKGRFQGLAPDDVIYLIMPDRFANGDLANDDPEPARGQHDRTRSRMYHGGDLQGIIQRLPYLKELGVTALWLNPWYENSNETPERGRPRTDYHGYSAVDFYAVENHFGDLAKLQELVEQAHAHGLKVIQDQIANHSGPRHPWVQTPPTTTWLNGTLAAHRSNPYNIWAIADPHASPSLRRETLDGWFANILPDFNQDDPECARYLIQNALWWVGITGLDAIRQDTLPYVPRSFWNTWSGALRREHPKLTLIGEVMDTETPNVAFFQGGRKQYDGLDTGVDTLFDFPLYYALRRVFIQGQSPKQLARQLAADLIYPNPKALVTLLGLHDVSRFMNERGATLDGLKLAFSFLLTTRGVPMIYYGDEIAMRGGDDPDNRRDFPGGWPGDPANAFTVEGRNSEQNEIFDHVKHLLKLRREVPALRRGKLVQLVATDRAYACARQSKDELAIVVLNNSTNTIRIEVPVAGLPVREGTTFQNRLRSDTVAPVSVLNAKLNFELSARSAAIVTRQ